MISKVNFIIFLIKLNAGVLDLWFSRKQFCPQVQKKSAWSLEPCLSGYKVLLEHAVFYHKRFLHETMSFYHRSFYQKNKHD